MMDVAALRPAQLKGLEPGAVLGAATLPAVTMTQLAFYCAAVGVTDPIHYDRDFARRAGFPDAVVNGSLRVAWMAQLLDALAPPGSGEPRRLACSHRGLMLVGQVPRYEARLRAQSLAADGTCVVEVEVTGTVDGRITDQGEATLHLKGGAAC